MKPTKITCADGTVVEIRDWSHQSIPEFIEDCRAGRVLAVGTPIDEAIAELVGDDEVSHVRRIPRPDPRTGR